MRRLYLDTDILLDYLLDRKDKMRPLGEFAFQLLKRTLSCEFVITISDFVIRELDNTKPNWRDYNMFPELYALGKITLAELDSVYLKEAERINKEYDVPWFDSIHYVLAKKSGCILVTQDKHFDELKKQNEVMIAKPEEL